MDTKHTPWFLLISRLCLFIALQALFALGFLLAGRMNAWQAGADCWPFVVTIANLIGFVLLLRFKGADYWNFFRFEKKYVGKDLLAMLGVLVLTAPIAFIPNIALGAWLFGDPQAPLGLLVRPLPLWAAYAGMILFPITQGLAELPTYFGFVMPRFESQGLPAWLSLTLPAVFLGLQHLALPLLFDVRFVAWRALMFLPFAFLVGIVLRWRPRLMPYLLVVHVLMDLSFAAMFLSAAY